MLEIKNITKRYDGVNGIRNISLNISEGEIWGIMGVNGAGKSTLMKIVSGILQPESGDVLYDGESIYKDISTYQEKIGYMPDFFGSYDNITVIEYLLFYAGIYGIHDEEADKRCIELLKQLRLYDVMQSYVDSLSRGMKQKLCLARAILHKPSVLILDEPCSGMDAETRTLVKQFLVEESLYGTTILISSHIITDLTDICTNITVLKESKVSFSGTMEEIEDYINENNPIYISVIEGKQTALTILKEDPRVLSISIDDNLLMVNFDGNAKDESELLASLFEAGCTISSFDRKKENFNKLFMGHTISE